jgi:hypothetical protein
VTLAKTTIARRYSERARTRGSAPGRPRRRRPRRSRWTGASWSDCRARKRRAQLGDEGSADASPPVRLERPGVENAAIAGLVEGHRGDDGLVLQTRSDRRRSARRRPRRSAAGSRNTAPARRAEVRLLSRRPSALERHAHGSAWSPRGDLRARRAAPAWFRRNPRPSPPVRGKTRGDTVVRAPPRRLTHRSQEASPGGPTRGRVFRVSRQREKVRLCSHFACRRRDSNPRHADYDSASLWLCSCV